MRLFRKVLLATLWSVALAIPAEVRADLLGDGLAACGRGDFSTAISLLRPLAEAGNPDAQHCLGVMYFFGKGVEKDYAEASRWLTPSAKQGNGVSQDLLGVSYAYGLGVARDWIRAYVWLSLAVSNGGVVGADRLRDFIGTRLLTTVQVTEAKELAQKCLASNYSQCE
jgi:TPR repeat protein